MNLNLKNKNEKLYTDSSTPLVSIVMPAYNSERYIPKSIESVKNQREKNWELIIVDDNSNDSTVKLVEEEISKDTKINLFINKENKGPSFTRNLGVEKARGKYIVFLDSDDLLSSTAISERVSVLKKDLNAAGSYCDMILIDKEGKSLGIKTNFQNVINYFDLVENKFPTTLVMLKASILQTEGGFNTSLRYGEDWDLWLRLTRTGLYFVKASNCNVFYRQSHSSLTHPSILEDHKNRMKVLDKSWDFDPNCKNPLKEFKNGFGDAFKTKYKTQKAFVVAMAEAAIGNKNSANEIMKDVSLNILTIMDRSEVTSRCKFMIKRNLCIDEKEWIIRSKDIKSFLHDFLKEYRTEKTGVFIDKFIKQLFSDKGYFSNIIKDGEKNVMFNIIKKIAANVIINKIIGFIFTITSKINTIVARIYYLNNN